MIVASKKKGAIALAFRKKRAVHPVRLAALAALLLFTVSLFSGCSALSSLDVTSAVTATQTAAASSAPGQTGSSAPGTTVQAPNPEGSYTSAQDVALYVHAFGELPPNFITKAQARALGWSSGALEPYAPGKCIGGDRFGNFEGLLPAAPGRVYTECDIGTLGARDRGAERLVFSNDGLIYYTQDHYQSFTMLYDGEENG